MFWSIAKGLGRTLLGRGGKKAAVEGGERVVRSVAREVTQTARGAAAPTTRQQARAARTVIRRPSTPEMAERFYMPPEAGRETARAATGAVSRTGGDTVARAGEAAARRAGEAAPISRTRAAARRALYGPQAGTRMSPVDLSAARRLGRVAKRVGIPVVGIGGSLAALGLLGGGEEEAPEVFSFLPEGGAPLFPPPGPDATEEEVSDYEQLIREEALAKMGQFDPFATEGAGMAGAGGAAGGDPYADIRSGFGDWASTLRGYGTAKGAGLRGTYGELSEQALADAAKAEAIAQAAYQDIGRIGTDYAAQATQDIQSPGAGGPTELTGLTPVTGESYDIPGRIADTAQIAADYVLRDLNLTRDDLNFMSGMAKQMGPAYEAQLNENLAMLIADKQFELEQSIFAQQAEDRRMAEASRQDAINKYYERMLAVALMDEQKKQEQQAQQQLTPEAILEYSRNFQGFMDTAEGRKSLEAAGIDLSNPQAAFQQYLLMQLRASQQSSGS